MQGMKTTGKELVERWIQKNRKWGKTNEEMNGTTFVYGNEILTLTFNEKGSFDINSRQTNIVVFRKMDELDMGNTCRACGMEYPSYREAVECCAGIED